MQQRRGTAAEWTSANTVLSAGEIGFETDTSKFKIGDGATAWNSLPYFVNANDIETGLLDTDEVSEGTINLYFTAQRAVDAVINGSVDTDDIEEGTTNLYFTDQRAIDAVGENLALDALSDVATAGVADGDALVYDTTSTSWVPGSVAIDALNDIADVDTTGVQDGYVLTYDTSSTSWTAQEASGGFKDIVIQNDEVGVASPAGSQWQDGPNVFLEESTYVLTKMVYRDNMFLTYYSGTIAARSTDLISWSTSQTTIAADVPTSSTFVGLLGIDFIDYANGVYLVGGERQLSASTDFVSWTTVLQGSGTASSYQTAAYGSSGWVAFVEQNNLARSTDGISWTNEPFTINTTVLNFKYINGEYWLLGQADLLRKSTDLVSWTSVNSSLPFNANLYDIDYSEDSGYVVVGGYNGLAHSTDGFYFSIKSDTDERELASLYPEMIGSTSYTVSSVANHNGLWVAGGSSYIETSTDGNYWSANMGSRDVDYLLGDIRSILNVDGEWIAVGQTGRTRVSEDVLGPVETNISISSSEVGKILNINRSKIINILVPTNSSESIDIKSELTIVNSGSANAIIYPESGVSINGLDTDFVLNPGASASLLKIDTDEWIARFSNANSLNSNNLNNNYSIYYNSQENEWQSKSIQSFADVETFTHSGGSEIFQEFDQLQFTDNGYVEQSYFSQESNEFILVNQNPDTVFYSSDASSWSTLVDVDYNYSVTAVHGENGYFVTVDDSSGSYGILSTDKITWTTTFSSTAIWPLMASYRNNQYILVGHDSNQDWSATQALAAISTDAINWQTSSLTMAGGPQGGMPLINGVAYGDGLWIVVADYNTYDGEGQAAISTNGISWSTLSANQYIVGQQGNEASNINDVEYYPSIGFIATGHLGMTISTDGLSWSQMSESQFLQDYFYDSRLSSIDSLPVMMRNNRIYTSTNGVSWTTVESSFFDSNISLENLEINSDGDTAIVFKTGQSDIYKTQGVDVSESYRNISSEDLGKLIVADSDYTTRFTLPKNIEKNNSISFTKKKSSDVEILPYTEKKYIRTGYYYPGFGTSDDIFDGVYVNGNYFVVGQDGDAASSTNGVNWTFRTNPFSSPQLDIVSVIHVNDEFYISGQNGWAAKSTDTISWTTIAQSIISGDPNDRLIINNKNGIWFAASSRGVKTSTDTVTWTTLNLNIFKGGLGPITSEKNFLDYSSDSGKYGIAGAGGSIAYSTDLASWTAVDSPSTKLDPTGYTYEIAYNEANKIWTARSFDHAVSYSTDLLSWQASNIPPIENITVFEYDPFSNSWALASSLIDQYFHTSTDLISWSVAGYNTFEILNSVVFNEAGQALYLADDGQVVLWTYGDDTSNSPDVYSTPGNKLRDQWSVATAVSLGNDEWLVTGDLSE